jgi:hypothetical protein
VPVAWTCWISSLDAGQLQVGDVDGLAVGGARTDDALGCFADDQDGDVGVACDGHGPGDAGTVAVVDPAALLIGNECSGRGSGRDRGEDGGMGRLGGQGA